MIEPHLRRSVRQAAGRSWEVLGWVVFGVDGSKIDVPMTRANEDALGVASRKRAGPQMLLADAGFTGYELLKAIIDSNRSLLIRVGSNVRLLTKLGYRVQQFPDGLVWLWPQAAYFATRWPAPGVPLARTATEEEVLQAQRLAERLTAA